MTEELKEPKYEEKETDTEPTKEQKEDIKYNRFPDETEEDEIELEW